jgi:tripartite-type tricarboxylate transporter receptor subunit TctC
VTLPRRKFLRMAVSAAALPAISRIARAQSYPSRPVRFVVGFPAGGAPDVIARLIGQWLSERFGQPFIIENRPGAGSIISAEEVVRAPADGYTLLLVASPNVITGPLYEKIDFNFLRDMAPVASLVRNPFVMEVNLSFPAESVPEFINYAKAHPGQINMAATGAGNLTQFAGDLFKMMAGVDMLDVPYGGEAQAQTELLSGRAQVMFDPLLSAIGYVKAGKLRALAVTTATRLDALPAVPTIGEFVPGYDVAGSLGVAAPHGTPAAIIGILNGAINAGLADAKIRGRLVQLGSVPVTMTATAFGNFIAKETVTWSKVVQFARQRPG